jgi:hypothetical protein
MRASRRPCPPATTTLPMRAGGFLSTKAGWAGYGGSFGGAGINASTHHTNTILVRRCMCTACEAGSVSRVGVLELVGRP